MSFPHSRSWIEDRRAQILSELEVLESLTTSRTALFSQSASRITDRATALASEHTDPSNVRPRLEAKVEAILQAAFPAGLPDSSPVSGNSTTKLFLSDALVLLGLSLKSDPQGTVRGLLKAPIDALVQAIQTGLTAVAQTQGVLAQIATEAIGQGTSLRADDPRLESLGLGLSQAQDGVERILANLSGQQPINPVLSQQVQSFLKSSLDALVQGTGSLDRLDAVTQGLTGGLLETLQSTEDSIQRLKANLAKFRHGYETTATGLNADRAQVSGVLTQVVQLQETIALLRERQPELASFRSGWLDLLAVLLALTRESRTVAAQNVFNDDIALQTDYQALLDGLALVPATDLSGLTVDMMSLRGLLLGLSLGAGFQEQYDATLQRAQSLLTIYTDRLHTLQGIAQGYNTGNSPLLEKLLDVVRDAKMKVAEDALTSGDIEAFMALTTGNLNAIDLISQELLGFLEGDADLLATMGKDLADGLGLVRSFEGNDIQAAQGFEDSRRAAIAQLKDDLINLERLESVLNKAAARGA